MKKFLQINSNSLKSHDAKSFEELWSKVKDNYDGIALNFGAEFKKLDDNRFNAVFSTPTEDRDGDIIHQNFELLSFRKNPVLLDSHRYDSIEHIVGKVVDIHTLEGKLKGEVKFALDNPKGMLAAKLADQGFLNATSIGFIPKEFDEDGNIKRSEILEISVVGVPSNPEALFEKGQKEMKFKLSDGKVIKIKQKGDEIEIEEPTEEELEEIEDEDIEDPEEEKEDIEDPEEPEDEDEEEDEEEEDEEPEKSIKPKKTKKEMLREASKKAKKERYGKLKVLNRIAEEYLDEIDKSDKDQISKQEKRTVNKVVRKLLDAKK